MCLIMQIMFSVLLLSGFQESTEIQIPLILSSIPVCMETQTDSIRTIQKDQLYLLTWQDIKFTFVSYTVL